ncbi:hypothetical protein H5410_042858, partial [Solanum commersonii]
MRSINLTNLCMEEDDYTTKNFFYCNHGFVVCLKTSCTLNNPGRRYWSYPYYGGPRSCHFWCWKDKENIDSRSKFVTEEVDKPDDFKQDDDCLGMKLKMLQEEVEKMKGMQNKWRRTWQ